MPHSPAESLAALLGMIDSPEWTPADRAQADRNATLARQALSRLGVDLADPDHAGIVAAVWLQLAYIASVGEEMGGKAFAHECMASATHSIAQAIRDTHHWKRQEANR